MVLKDAFQVFDKRPMHVTKFIVFKDKRNTERERDLVLGHGVIEGIDESRIIPQFTFLPHFLLAFRLCCLPITLDNSNRSTLSHHAEHKSHFYMHQIWARSFGLVGFDPTQFHFGLH